MSPPSWLAARSGPAVVIEEGARGRRTYAITDAGREELRRWMRNPPDTYLVRNEFVLRLFLLSALEPAEARAALLDLAAENDAALAALREQVDTFDASADPGTPPPLGRLVADSACGPTRRCGNGRSGRWTT